MEARCSVCDLDQTHRKIGEVLLKERVSIRDVADLVNCWAEKNNLPKTYKSAWGRHRQNSHYSATEVKPTDDDGQPLSVDEMVAHLWSQYQSARRRGAPPSTKEMFEILQMRAKLRADLERADEDKQQRELLMGASPQENT